MAESQVLTTFENGITTITLNRPDKRNAFNDEIIQTLTDTLEKIANDSNTRVVILQAKGKCFSAGADLSWMQKMANYSFAENQDDALALSKLMYTLNELPQATIALVQGHAYGGGVALVACCDIAIANPTANFCFSETKFGLIPAVISPFIIAKIGEHAARRLFLTAEVFSAEAALNYGLLHEVVAADALTIRGHEIAKQICQNGPEAVKAAKVLVRDTVTKFHDQDYLRKHLAKCIADIRISPEGQEGLQAFLEKRQANWIKE